MSDIRELLRKAVSFRDARDWKQFHTPKDLCMNILVEAGEVAEHFLWKTDEQISAHLEKNKDEVGEELADVLYSLLLLANDTDIDMAKAFEKKMLKNESKYPQEESKGKNLKYHAYGKNKESSS